MALTDQKIGPTARTGQMCYMMALGTTAVSQTNKRTHSILPGYRFQIVGVQVYALTVTATITVSVVKNNAIGTTFLTGAITPVADTATNGTLLTTTASLRGITTDTIDLLYTSNGSGAATNCLVAVWVRPYPMATEY